ncbi:hypothetical protein K505DRAFT_95919 [Melanomma pulvis-pyrius CBS 109.77]|uniref:Uncharacterized protein n=1 Tax=Melanomma pulvis-pyrius CBS 109.77 TaxID=1314802 RepID=A0A6A6WZ04_9PLEO|nr:hypothetical protein K505DRAFT_95919 [Melanomma pulvis-pyrius CBS 109.77]
MCGTHPTTLVQWAMERRQPARDAPGSGYECRGAGHRHDRHRHRHDRAHRLNAATRLAALCVRGVLNAISTTSRNLTSRATARRPRASARAVSSLDEIRADSPTARRASRARAAIMARSMLAPAVPPVPSPRASPTRPWVPPTTTLSTPSSASGVIPSSWPSSHAAISALRAAIATGEWNGRVAVQQSEDGSATDQRREQDSAPAVRPRNLVSSILPSPVLQ